MSTHPQIPRGSDADVAEAGLDVEASFAEVDAQTSRRMSMEAAAQKDRGSGGDHTGGLPENLPRRPNGPNAMDMLTSPNQEGPPGTAHDGGGRG